MPAAHRALLPLFFLLFLLAGCSNAAKQAADLVIRLDRQRAGLERKEIEIPGGLRYAYLEGGQGEPLMLLHGFGANKDNFVRSARYLTPHYRVIIPDHIGFGESSHPADADYTAAAQARRLRMLAQALGIRVLHLGGNSMGGQIAMEYAVLHPQEVASLWLLDPAGIWSAPRSELAQILLATGRNPLIAHNEDEFAALFDFAMSDPPYVPRPILDVFAQERIRNAALEQRIFPQIATDSIEQRVKGLATPALIVWGERDRVIHPATAEVLHRLLPHSQVRMLPGTGHLPMLEHPYRSAEDYLRFRTAMDDVRPALAQ